MDRMCLYTILIVILSMWVNGANKLILLAYNVSIICKRSLIKRELFEQLFVNLLKKYLKVQCPVLPVHVKMNAVTFEVNMINYSQDTTAQR